MTCRFSSNYLKASFMGRVWICESLMSSFRIEEIEFPVDAFKDFLRAEGLPMPDFWQDVPGTALKPAPVACPVTAAPSQQDECREVESAPVAAAPDDMEVVPGVTVGNLRAMIDEKSSAYCPRLLAAIQTKIALMPRESILRNDTVYERYAKTESVSRLKALGVVNPKDKSRNPDPADLDVNAVARILCRKHKKKEGHPGSL